MAAVDEQMWPLVMVNYLPQHWTEERLLEVFAK
jgi:hypothetical protein